MSNNGKSFFIDSVDHVQASSHMFFSTHTPMKTFSTQFKLRRDNYTSKTSIEAGSRVISAQGYTAVGDLLFSIGWGNGFGVYQLQNDGSLVNLYSDEKPANNYAYWTSIAVDSVRKQVYVGTYVRDNLVRYTYTYDGTNFTATKEVLTESSHGLPSDRVGYLYNSSLYVVGDWLYIAPYDRNTGEMLRWNVVNETTDNLPVINKRNNGRYGVLYYDKLNNRLYVTWRELGEYWVVLNPDSGENAKCYCIRYAEFVTSYASVYAPIFSVDPGNANHVWVSTRFGKLAKIDFTNILNESDVLSTLLFKDPVLSSTGLKASPYNTEVYQRFYEHPTLKGGFIYVLAASDSYRDGGWLDQERGVPVGVSRTSGFVPGSSVLVNSHASDYPLRFSYGAVPVLGTSANGSKYWIIGGYGQTGNVFRTYAEAISPDGQVLELESEIIFGNYELDDQSTVGSILISNLIENMHTPAGTSYNCYVSNNGGITWEVYDTNSQAKHIFTSSGSSVQIKVSLHGIPTAAPYFESLSNIQVGIYAYSAVEDMSQYRGRARLLIRGI